MRKKQTFAAASILAICVSSFMMNCTRSISNEVSNKDIVAINEKMFLAQVNDVYLNTEDYLGKTIKLEGIFKSARYYDSEEPFCYVIRYGPGCCGDDANAGFEVRWDKDQKQPYPAVDSWVEATGTLKRYEINGNKFLYLGLASLETLSKRGAETVLQ